MFKIILIMTLLIGGCNISTNQLQPPIEEKKVVAKHEPWPEGEKEYWIARYFFIMAADPRVQQIMLPRDAYEIVVCTINKYEEEHSWEWFTMFLHDNPVLQPQIEQYVSDTTRVCAVKQKAKTDALKPIELKESI
jgi:hypothetical protein